MPPFLCFTQHFRTVAQAAAESVLTPRFYTTDFDEMEQLFSQDLNPNLDMTELEVLPPALTATLRVFVTNGGIVPCGIDDCMSDSLLLIYRWQLHFWQWSATGILSTWSSHIYVLEAQM